LSFGHANAKVLDGGLKKWIRESRPTETGILRPTSGHLSSSLDSAYVRDKQHVLENVASRAEQVVDARARDRFEGSVAEP